MSNVKLTDKELRVLIERYGKAIAQGVRNGANSFDLNTSGNRLVELVGLLVIEEK